MIMYRVKLFDIEKVYLQQARTSHRADRARARCAPRNLIWALWRPLALAPPCSMLEPG
jgi:hypothetical protein